MQKFNESKQSGETVPEEAAKTPENVESVKENNKENGDASIDSRQSPAGEAKEDERDTATPNAQVNSMSESSFVDRCWSGYFGFIVILLPTTFINRFRFVFLLSRRANEYHPWSGHVLFLPYHCCASCWRDIVLLSRQW